jgi:F-type H+-transporting ATPase subunit epsilon
VIEVQPDLVTIMADAAENVLEIDVSRAEAAKRRAEDILKQGPPPDSDSYLKIESALRRSNLRLEAVKRYRGQRTRFPGMSEESQK